VFAPTPEARDPLEETGCRSLPQGGYREGGYQAPTQDGASKCWDEDPFARGVYAYFKPGQIMELGPAIASGEGRVHFAGDHTSCRPGFMHGAVSSARRVVREILAADK